VVGTSEDVRAGTSSERSAAAVGGGTAGATAGGKGSVATEALLPLAAPQMLRLAGTVGWLECEIEPPRSEGAEHRPTGAHGYALQASGAWASRGTSAAAGLVPWVTGRAHGLAGACRIASHLESLVCGARCRACGRTKSSQCLRAASTAPRRPGKAPTASRPACRLRRLRHSRCL
jgi:hypothetical protein